MDIRWRGKSCSKDCGLSCRHEFPAFEESLGEELLRVHKNYQPLLAKVPRGMIHGLAHITGGGLIDNLPRVLPKNCDAVIDTQQLARAGDFQFPRQNGKG